VKSIVSDGRLLVFSVRSRVLYNCYLLYCYCCFFKINRSFSNCVRIFTI